MGERRFEPVGDGSGLERDDRFHAEELRLALRNKSMPLEGLRYDITPTGMHYLLVHYDIPYVDQNDWRLNVGGLVSKQLSLTLDDIRRRPAVTLAVTMECAGNGRALMSPRAISQPWLSEAVGTAEWTGTPLRGLLAEAGVDGDAVEILFTGLDRGLEAEELQSYQRSLTLDEANQPNVLLAYEMNGRPLEPQHGFPLRLLVPGWYGMASVKWLDRIEAIREPFQGYQQARAYRYSQSRDDPGEPVSLINVRALMTPPGVPDFLTRGRLLGAGRVEIRGRAWAGRIPVAKVEVSTDGGSSWTEAELGPQPSPLAWRGWRWRWDATPGRHTLIVRGTDAAGNVQPVEAAWNYRGMGNNVAQRVDVLVE